MGAIYGALEHPIVYKWAIPLHGSWLAAGKWVKVFHYINQLQFSIITMTALGYGLLYFCLPARRFTEVCVIVILQWWMKKEIINEWDFNFQQSCSFSIQHTFFLVTFLLVKASLKVFFWCGVKLYFISSNIWYVFLNWFFSLENEKNYG